MDSKAFNHSSTTTAGIRTRRSRNGAGRRRLGGALVLGLTASVAMLGLFGAAPAGAESPPVHDGFSRYKLENAWPDGASNTILFAEQTPHGEYDIASGRGPVKPADPGFVGGIYVAAGDVNIPPPPEDCHPSPYISICDEAAAPPVGEDPVLKNGTLKSLPGGEDCNPSPYVSECDLMADDGFQEFQRHTSVDSLSATLCRVDTSPDPVSCKPDLN